MEEPSLLIAPLPDLRVQASDKYTSHGQNSALLIEKARSEHVPRGHIGIRDDHQPFTFDHPFGKDPFINLRRINAKIRFNLMPFSFPDYTSCLPQVSSQIVSQILIEKKSGCVSAAKNFSKIFHLSLHECDERLNLTPIEERKDYK